MLNLPVRPLLPIGGIPLHNQARSGRRKGCLIFIAVALLVLTAAVLYGAWRLRFLQIGQLEPISREASALREAPVDAAASQALNQSLASTGVKGISTAVVPLKGSGGNAALIVVDTGGGFVPATGTEGKRKQALAAIKELVRADSRGKLNLERVGLEYQEHGKALIALTAPMSALKDLDAGKITESQFLSRVEVKVQDSQVVKDLLDKFR